jgi:hypothetical protein
MRQTMRMRGVMVHGTIAAALAAVIAGTVATLAQIPFVPPTDPNQRQVALARQEASDCSGSDVPSDPPETGGTIWATRLFDGNTSVKVAMTAKPNTTYRLSLKCVRPLGEVKTDDEGIASTALVFPTNLVGPVYSFELAPEPARPGDKYQSAQVSFR